MSTGPAGGGTTPPRTSRSSTSSATRRSSSAAMGGFQNFAISFTIISILAGCLTSYYIAFERGGPIAITWGWLLVGLMSTIIALAMAEIASAFPTAGGLYYWASKLGSPGWGWATGWFNLIGQIAVTAAIGYGLATFAEVLFDDWFAYATHMNDWFGFSYNASIYVLYAIFLARGVPDQHLRRQHHVDAEHGLGVLAHGGRRRASSLVLIVVPNHHQSVSYVFTRHGEQLRLRRHGDRLPIRAFWFVFGLGLLMLAVHDHRLRRLCAHGRGDAAGLAHGGGRHVHVGGRLGHLRLDPAAGRHVRDPEHPGRARQHRHGRAVDLVRVDEPELVGARCSSSASSRSSSA